MNQRSLAVLALLFIGACSDQVTDPPPPLPATGISVAALPTNALGAAVTYTVQRAARTRVLYWKDTETTPFDVRVTPTIDVAASDGDQIRVAVLGLNAETGYRGVVETITEKDTARSDTVSFVSGSLPQPLNVLRLRITTGIPTHGYTLVGGRRTDQTVYAVAFDSTGTIVWYRGFDVGLFGPGEIKQQANGDFTMFLGATSGWTPTAGYFVQFRPNGDVVNTFQVPAPYWTDNHDLLLRFKDGKLTSALFFAYEMRRADLTSIGGPADTLFAYHRVVEWIPPGTTKLFFDVEKYFSLQDRVDPPILPPYDLAHPNSIDVDSKGNYIVSWRNVGEVMALDPQTFAIKWRLGGSHATLRTIGDPLGFFSGQHCAFMTSPNRVLIYDNGPRHNPPVTRAVEYQIDTVAKTAALVWSFTHPRGLFNRVEGCAQRLPNGNTLVTYSVHGTVTEVDVAGNIVFEGIVEDSGAVHNHYRAIRIMSLYGPN
jgi:hypothetical protein